MAGDGMWRQIAVPSRLYSRITEKRPLAGKRISVKDNFKVAGIRTTQTNRAWTSLYGPEEETAAFIQNLVNLGAIIVGKTKMCSFASSEEPTDQWVDFHAPFNPGADGYQSPSGSTTGGGASLASYKWFGLSVGTDSKWPSTILHLPFLRYADIQTKQLEVSDGLQLGMACSVCGSHGEPTSSRAYTLVAG